MTAHAGGRAGHWSTHQFTEYFAAVSGPEDEEDVVRIAVERAAETLDAEFATAVVEDRLVQSIGFGRDVVTRESVRDLPLGGSSTTHPSFGVVQWLVAPLDGQGSRSTSVRGSLTVGRIDAPPFTPEEEQMLRAMATVVGLVLRNLRSLVVERARQNLLSGLLDVQRLISARRPIQEVLDAVTQATSDLLGASSSCLVLFATGPVDPLTVVSRHSRVARLLEPTDGLDPARQAVEAQGLVQLPDDHPCPPGEEPQQVVAVPVKIADEYAGALVAWHTWRQRDEVAQADLLQMFAQQVSVALTDADSMARMNEALHDPLTGLASRVLFLDRLSHAASVAARREDLLAILFIDLDGFKQINDTHGHAAGDEVLRTVGARLSTAIRASDSAGRLGGDEFVVLLEGFTARQAGATARRLHRALAEPIVIGAVRVRVQASIGIASDRGGHLAPQTLLGLADAAMYEAKRSGAGRTSIHSPLDGVGIGDRVPELTTERG